jgi:hypothetical protein
MTPAGEDEHHQPLVPRRRLAGEHEDAWSRLVEPARAFRRGDPAVVEVQGGSLVAGERSMLSGCKLNDRTRRIVGHARTVRAGCRSQDL